MAVFSLIILSLSNLVILTAQAQIYSLKYDLGYSGVPFAGGVISMISGFTNTGQLTIRVTGVSFASDFWTNGTRQLTSEVPFNLTAGMNRPVATPVQIPTSATIGNHTVTGTATWQYGNSSGWFNASSVVVSKSVLVSQTIGSLLSSFATLLAIGLGVVAVVVVLVVFLVVRQRRKPKPMAS